MVEVHLLSPVVFRLRETIRRFQNGKFASQQVKLTQRYSLCCSSSQDMSLSSGFRFGLCNISQAFPVHLRFDMLYDRTFLLRYYFIASVTSQFLWNNSKMIVRELFQMVLGTCTNSCFTSSLLILPFVSMRLSLTCNCAMAAPPGIRNIAPAFSATAIGSSSTFSSPDEVDESDRAPPNRS